MPLSNLTNEQLIAVNYISSTTGLSLISAVAGAGKTTLLNAIANSVPHTNSIYLAYNSSLAKEAKSKFPSSVDCRTMHSLAYRAIIPSLKLTVGYFNPRDMNEPWSYDEKQTFIDILREFCLSSFTDFSAFLADSHYSLAFESTGNKYLNLMHDGKLECTHDFYLKLFHIMLENGSITYDPFDIILYDEIQDMAPVAAAIFDLLPAQRKVGVGDKYQAIYSFNHTINYFELVPNDTPIFYLSQSFRVPDTIAPLIEAFCVKYIDSAMSFKGIPLTNPTITTRAYLTRTNSSLISKIIELNESHTPYTLIRKPQDIFKLPLILLGLKYKGFIANPEYRYLQEHVNDWYSDPDLRQRFKSALAYINYLNADQDLQLKQAITLIARYGSSTIMRAFEQSKAHLNTKTNYILCTAHSSKGLEYDEVTLAPDMNDSIADILLKFNDDPSYEPSREENESLFLYYVSITRTRVVLHNALHL